MTKLRGLYAITDAHLCRDNIIASVEQAILGGAKIIQYRDKNHDRPRRYQEAFALLQLCRRHRVPLIVNDDLKLALEIGADGVHLGKDDCDIGLARAQLHSRNGNAIIGISCYNEWPLAKAAADAGADYIAFGAFYPSTIKPNAVKADLALLEKSKRELGIPVVAIGGITVENGTPLISAGADMLAVISGVFAQTDIRNAAQDFAALFDN